MCVFVCTLVCGYWCVAVGVLCWCLRTTVLPCAPAVNGPITYCHLIYLTDSNPNTNAHSTIYTFPYKGAGRDPFLASLLDFTAPGAAEWFQGVYVCISGGWLIGWLMGQACMPTDRPTHTHPSQSINPLMNNPGRMQEGLDLGFLGWMYDYGEYVSPYTTVRA